LAPSASTDSDVVHLVVVPNYREDETMLEQTLESIVQAWGSEGFHVALAMEAREGPEGERKAQRLREKFAPRFARVFVTSHPADLLECHLDDSSDREVPGKASNLKWALRQAHEAYQKEGLLAAADVVLTVADADVLFHPGYFRQLGQEFSALREAPGSEHLWTMWQAPQLPFRNFYEAPLCSRVWAYVASVYECGGVVGLSFGGQHLTFSTYSLPLQLAISAQAHEGDVVAEDHHAYLRCFFYAARASVLKALDAGEKEARCSPPLRLRPLYLPVKATSVVSAQGACRSWVERWLQAKRHAQGVAELSYALLAACDTLRQVPLEFCSAALLWPLARIIVKLLYIHLLPSCQFVAMVALCLLQAQYAGGGGLPACSEEAAAGRGTRVLCAVAGVWAPAWPVAVPMLFIVASSVLLVWTSFLQPAAKGSAADGSISGRLWSDENGGFPKGGPRASPQRLVALVAFDVLVFGGLLVVPYGVMPAVLAFWGVCLRGNRFHYVTAAKAMSTSLQKAPPQQQPLVAASE